MNKMQKLTCAKVLKVIFYLLGFPLLMLFVAKDSMIFFNEGAFSERRKTALRRRSFCGQVSHCFKSGFTLY